MSSMYAVALTGFTLAPSPGRAGSDMDRDAIDSGRKKALSDFRGACFSISAALLAGLTVTWALSATGFLLGVPVGHSQSICGAVTAVIVVYRLSLAPIKRVVHCLILILL